MKKFKGKTMKKLLVLLFVAAMCMPCYAVVNTNILVYQFTRTFDPWIDYSDANQTLATNVGTQRTTGYLVLNADVDADANTWELNAGADPTLIFYGGTGINKWGVSFNVNDDVNDANGSMGIRLFSLQGKTDKGLLFVIDANTEQETVGASYSTLYGKTGKLDIGKGALHKEGVPSSMKGIVEEWADTVDSFEGFGNTTMTLNSLYTKWANAGSKNQAQTVDKIIADLGNLGYPFAGALQARIDTALANRAAGYPPVIVPVPAGTYPGDVVINEPNVTLKSASGAAVTIIQTATTEPGVSINANYVTLGGSAGHGFTITSKNAVDMNDYVDSVVTVQVGVAHTKISHNTIVADGHAHYNLLVLTGASDLLISNNTFTGDSEALPDGAGVMRLIQVNDINVIGNIANGNGLIHYGFQVNGCGGDALIADNTLTNFIGAGGVVVTSDVGTDSVERMTIHHNNISGCKRGILITDEDDDDSTGDINDVTITHNTIQNNVTGLKIGGYGDDSKVLVANFVVEDNKFLGNVLKQVENVTGTGLDAELNWWGSASGPYHSSNLGGLGGSVSDDVDFAPYWINAAMTIHN